MGVLGLGLGYELWVGLGWLSWLVGLLWLKLGVGLVLFDWLIWWTCFLFFGSGSMFTTLCCLSQGTCRVGPFENLAR